MVAVDVAVVVTVALLGVLVAGLLRSHAEVLRALHGMGVNLDPGGGTGGHQPGPAGRGGHQHGPAGAGTNHPVSLGARPTPGRPDATDVVDLVGVTPTGEAVSVAVTSVRHDTLIAFLTSGCSTCRGFWDAFRGVAPDVPGGARLVAVTRGPEAESAGTLSHLGGQGVPVVMSTDTWEHYDVPAAPYFVYVSGPGAKVVGEGTAATWDQVRTLVSSAVADATTGPRAGRGDRIDSELSAAGILPGDPRLHPAPSNRVSIHDEAKK